MTSPITKMEVPPDWFLPNLINIAKQSTCHRSKCASIVTVRDTGPLFHFIIGDGFNSMPCNSVGDCFKDYLPKGFKSDKTCCVHAEQRAIMDALKHWSHRIHEADIWFLRLDDQGNPMYSGAPYCSICSKMALDVGIKRFILYQEQGWIGYDTKYYNELTFKYNGN